MMACDVSPVAMFFLAVVLINFPRSKIYPLAFGHLIASGQDAKPDMGAAASKGGRPININLSSPQTDFPQRYLPFPNRFQCSIGQVSKPDKYPDITP